MDGRRTASIPVAGKIYFLYSLSAVAPFVKIRSILLFFIIKPISFGTAFLIELSDDPYISQEAITSQSAHAAAYHDARIQLDSQLGHGTRVRVLFHPSQEGEGV